MCYGTGLQSVACSECNGDGVTSQKIQMSVKIPKSVDNGMMLRVKGKGHEALNGVSGDLILKVEVDMFPGYSRDGYDLHSTKNISVTQAIFGGQCEIETIQGLKTIKIQPGTEHNHTVKMSGIGLQKLGKESGRGDHLVTFKIVIPNNLNKQ